MTGSDAVFYRGLSKNGEKNMAILHKKQEFKL